MVYLLNAFKIREKKLWETTKRFRLTFLEKKNLPLFIVTISILKRKKYQLKDTYNVLSFKNKIGFFITSSICEIAISI
jgi:hypothetical protein